MNRGKLKIDREKLLELMNENCNTNTCINEFDGSVKSCWECVADFLVRRGVVVPVRCWKCKYWVTDDDIGYCENPDGLDNYAMPDDFCSYAERKEE